jgi:hypothetical protein
LETRVDEGDGCGGGKEAVPGLVGGRRWCAYTSIYKENLPSVQHHTSVFGLQPRVYKER